MVIFCRLNSTSFDINTAASLTFHQLLRIKMSLIIKISFTVAFFAIFFGAVDQASAACPTVTPMANFDASKFVGTWFAIRRYSTILNGFATSCITMNSTFSNQNIFSLQLNNLFSQRTPIRIVGTLLSNGIYNLKLQVGLGKFHTFYEIIFFCMNFTFNS